MINTRKRKYKDARSDTLSVSSNTETINSNVSLQSADTIPLNSLTNKRENSVNKNKSLAEDSTAKKPRDQPSLSEINRRLVEENQQLKIEKANLIARANRYKTAYFDKVKKENINNEAVYQKVSDKTDKVLSKIAHIEYLLNTASLRQQTPHSENIHLATTNPTDSSALPTQPSNNNSQDQLNTDTYNIQSNLSTDNHAVQHLLLPLEDHSLIVIDPHASQAASIDNLAFNPPASMNASPSRQDRSQPSNYHFSNENLIMTSYLSHSFTSPQMLAGNISYSTQKREASTASSPTLSTYSPSPSIHLPLTSTRSCKMTLHQHFSSSFNNELKPRMNE